MKTRTAKIPTLALALALSSSLPFAAWSAPEVYEATEEEEDSMPAPSAPSAPSPQTEKASIPTSKNDTDILKAEKSEPISAVPQEGSNTEVRTEKTPVVVELEKRLQTLESELKSLRSEEKSVSKEANSADYEPVPTDQRTGIASRLKLVDELIRKFGRAYDYRVHTRADLEKIKKELE